MKLESLTNEKSKRKLKMIITTEQLHALANNVINEQEMGAIKKTYLLKQKPNVKKK
ncbi:MAG: hypothetical protein RJA53_707 [Bacteroidota bacterium]|jgi:hypothetical protein